MFSHFFKKRTEKEIIDHSIQEIPDPEAENFSSILNKSTDTKSAKDEGVTEEEYISPPARTDFTEIPDDTAFEFYSILMKLAQGEFVLVHPLSNDFRLLYARAFPDFELSLITKSIEGWEHFKTTEPEIIKDTVISFGDIAFEKLGFNESGKKFNTLDTDDVRKLRIEAGRILYNTIIPGDLYNKVAQSKTDKNEQELINNPFSLTRQQARDACHTTLAFCNGVPLPQNKAVLDTLLILEAGFLNIREYTKSYTMSSDGNKGITLQDDFRRHLVPFFEGCSNVASENLGFNCNEAPDNKSPEEIESFCIEVGYTLARSVFSVERSAERYI